MNCEQAGRQDLIEKYVAGQLPDPEMSAFESHYFTCDQCLEAVQLGQALHMGATASRPATSPKVLEMPPRTLARPRWMFALSAAAGVILVAVVGWRILVSKQTPAAEMAHTGVADQGASQAEKGNPPVEVSPKPAPAEPQLMASNADLGAIEPLGYRPSVLRGNNEDSGERFQKAMESYLKQDYRQTVAGLTGIPVAVPGSGKPEDHVSDAGIQLYLGISQLMLNQNADAIRSLGRAAAYGDTPYLENATFYEANALIRQKHFTEAAAWLKRTVQLKGDRQAEAQQLLEQLNNPTSR